LTFLFFLFFFFPFLFFQKVFYGASKFNRALLLWNVGKVTTMQHMFADTEKFNGDISTWAMDKVTTMAYMFQDALAFNRDLSKWNVIAATNMYDIFAGAKSFAQGAWCSSSWAASPFSTAPTSSICVVKSGDNSQSVCIYAEKQVSGAACISENVNDDDTNCEWVVNRVFCCGIGKYVSKPKNVVFPSRNVATIDCSNCPIGRYRNQLNLASKCLSCPRDKIAPAPGLPKCATCNKHNTCVVKEGGTNNDCALAVIKSSALKGRYKEDIEACAAATESGNGDNPANDCIFSMSSSKFYHQKNIILEEDSSFNIPLISSPFSDVDRKSCEKCGPGFWMDISGANTQCKRCGLGKFSASSGQTSCLDCPKGYQQHEVAAPFCLPCNPGKTNSQEGQESCQVCGAGTHMPFSKSIAPTCTNCIAGQYEEKGGATSCTSCPAGTYSAVVGSAALINCGTLRCSCVFVF
jgi:hypothetical protein